jgi:hypothetical protein
LFNLKILEVFMISVTKFLFEFDPDSIGGFAHKVTKSFAGNAADQSGMLSKLAHKTIAGNAADHPIGSNMRRIASRLTGGAIQPEAHRVLGPARVSADAWNPHGLSKVSAPEPVSAPARIPGPQPVSAPHPVAAPHPVSGPARIPGPQRVAGPARIPGPQRVGAGGWNPYGY